MLILYIRVIGDKKERVPEGTLSFSYVKVILNPSSQWN